MHQSLQAISKSYLQSINNGATTLFRDKELTTRRTKNRKSKNSFFWGMELGEEWCGHRTTGVHYKLFYSLLKHCLFLNACITLMLYLNGNILGMNI